MRRIYTIILIFFIHFAYFSCDKIEGEYRENPDELISTVTLFDFTGITCVNCPDAHDEVELLKEKFGENLQTISVHGDYGFAGPINGWFLVNNIGVKLTEQMQVEGLPQGSINTLKEFKYSPYTDWSNGIGRVGYVAPDLLLDVAFEINENDTTANVTVNGKFENELSVDYKNLEIGVYLIENKIIGPQYRLGVGTITDYEHEHVLRESFHNGGEISESFVPQVEAGMEIDEIAFSIKIDDKWNIENLEPVVFVFQKENMEFIPFKVNYK